MPNVINMDPALVETYSRLLVYTEIESLGIKGFLSQLLPAVFKSQAWGILHTLLEMLSYRMHHIQPFYRVQLLSHLHSLASVPHTNLTQLHLCVESTALRLITGLGSAEVPLQLTRYFTEPKLPGSAVSLESEEFNRTLILTIARSMHITGSGKFFVDKLNRNLFMLISVSQAMTINPQHGARIFLSQSCKIHRIHGLHTHWPVFQPF